MVQLDFREDILPHILAVLIFLVLTVAFYHPIFLKGYKLDQNDIRQGAGANQESIAYREETGKEALWTNSMFSGMPAYLINTYWSGELTRYVQQVISLGLSGAPGITFRLFVGFYILMLVLGVRPWLAMAGAISFGLSTFNIVSIEAGHHWKVNAIAYFPLVLSGFILLFRNYNYWLGTMVLSLALALEIKANHLQITYYIILSLIPFGLFVLWQVYKKKDYLAFAKAVGCLALVTVIAVGSHFGRLWSTYEYGQYSTRGKSDLNELLENDNQESGLKRDYVFAWSHGIGESFTFLAPNYMGGPSSQPVGMKSSLGNALSSRGLNGKQLRDQLQNVPTYWGKQPFTSGPIYFGVLPLFLFVLALFLIKDKTIKYWFLSITILSLLLAWGKNLSWFNYFLYDHLPGYDKFRSVSMAIVIASVAIPAFGFLGLNKFFSSNKKEQLYALKWSALIVIGLLIILLIYSFTGRFSGPGDGNFGLPSWYIQALQETRGELMRGDVLRSLLFLVFALVGLWFLHQQKWKDHYVIALVIGIVLIDLFSIDRRFIHQDNFIKDRKDNLFIASPADQVILQDKEHYRVLNLQNPFNEANTSYFHSSIGGYHGAKMKRYQELIDFGLSNEIQEMVSTLQSGSRDLSDFNLVNMLNARYIKYGDSKGAVIKNNNAFGNAWLVKEVIPVENADAALKATISRNLSEGVVVNTNKFPLAENTYSTGGTIRLEEYQPNQLTYSFESDKKSFAVFSEIFYPKGWKAYIDEKPVDILQVNYVLRGLPVPPGKHTISFSFVPEAYIIGNRISLISSILLIMVILGTGVKIFLERK
jgi:hypothetical protein